MTNYLIIDLEATCTDKDEFPRDEMEIIEIGAVMVDGKTFQPLGEFTTFIKPVRHPILTDFCRGLTSIEQADVDNADAYPTALGKFKDWIKIHPEAVFCSWGAYDKKQFHNDCDYHKIRYPFGYKHINLKVEFSKKQGFSKQFGMARALQRCNLSLDGTHHRGIDDARNMVKVMPYIFGDLKCPAQNK